MTEERAIEAIRDITSETGFPPSAEELAFVLDVPLKSVHSALGGAKNRGAVRYDADGHLVAGSATS